MAVPPPPPSLERPPLFPFSLSLSRESALVRDGGRGSRLPRPSPGAPDAAAGDPTRPSLFGFVQGKVWASPSCRRVGRSENGNGAVGGARDTYGGMGHERHGEMHRYPIFTSGRVSREKYAGQVKSHMHTSRRAEIQPWRTEPRTTNKPQKGM